MKLYLELLVLILLLVSCDFKTNSMLLNNIHRRDIKFRSNDNDAGINAPYTIEILVVVDRSTKQFHRNNNIESYVMSLMSIAANVLADTSIGTYLI